MNQELDIVVFNGDKFYIRHLIQNLLRNALEASPYNCLIKIIIESKKSVKIATLNQGIIPTNIQKNFFDKLITSGKNQGTGLGTYISEMTADPQMDL